jgi:hypothetical protein
MTTIAEIITAVASSLSVSGVVRQYTHPPVSLNTSDLPASFPWGFTREQGPMTSKTHGGWPTTRVDYWVVIEPVGQSTQPSNYADVQTLADALDDALADAISTVNIGKSTVTWSIRGGNQIVEIAGGAYWGVVAQIEGHG